MFRIDDLVCNVCGKVGCVSWAFTEGPRCHAHSSFVGPKAEAARNPRGPFELVGGRWVDRREAHPCPN